MPQSDKKNIPEQLIPEIKGVVLLWLQWAGYWWWTPFVAEMPQICVEKKVLVYYDILRKSICIISSTIIHISSNIGSKLFLSKCYALLFKIWFQNSTKVHSLSVPKDPKILAIGDLQTSTITNLTTTLEDATGCWKFRAMKRWDMKFTRSQHRFWISLSPLFPG